ncbi:hypothetical protein PsorP6_017884 [Peronosclerospora sorghi]|uniref:Uncharacterized protein n=1 Tax=Peronosclerospora sorghi TaxID=230839 RepID=A0ACC0WEE8_9STRA|nr:hypothetical protein PsorP6_017884 [Peronosclerospora sorghi]
MSDGGGSGESMIRANFVAASLVTPPPDSVNHKTTRGEAKALEMYCHCFLRTVVQILVFVCEHTQLAGCHVERLVLHLSRFDKVSPTGSAGRPPIFWGGLLLSLLMLLLLSVKREMMDGSLSSFGD